MMVDFSKCNKISGTYHVKGPIENFTFKVQIKSANMVIPLPTLHAITDSSFKEIILPLPQEQQIFYWQEKVFSARELSLFSQKRNCKEKHEEMYYRQIMDLDLSNSKHGKSIFSFINDDHFDLEPVVDGAVPYMLKRFLNMPRKGKMDCSIENVQTSPRMANAVKESLPFRDEVTHFEPNHYETMLIMADMSHHDGDPVFTLRKEVLLFKLLWNPESRHLTVNPNFNDFELNPYILEVNYESKQLYHYSIELVSKRSDRSSSAVKKELLSELKKFLTEHQISIAITNFIIPPRDVVRYLINFEIVSAEMFEYDNIYVEYQIDLPEKFKSNSICRGKTHTASTEGRRRRVSFGHVFEILIDCPMTNDEPNDFTLDSPKVYFEIISRGSWERRRTEGYCYISIPIMQSGRHKRCIGTVRPEGLNKRLADLNRFFLGGHHLLKDITWIGIPPDQQNGVFSKYGIRCVTSGSLEIRMDILKQNQRLLPSAEGMDFPDSVLNNMSTDTLFRSVNSALAAYKKARQRLINCQSAEGDTSDNTPRLVND